MTTLLKDIETEDLEHFKLVTRAAYAALGINSNVVILASKVQNAVLLTQWFWGIRIQVLLHSFTPEEAAEYLGGEYNGLDLIHIAVQQAP
jgi:hypothetical protein